jgi:eukaryotic-like serine/threonine-protein kinase
MNKENREFWEQLSTLYDQAIAMDEQSRLHFLENECPDNTLKHELESLLNVHTRSCQYFDSLSENVISPAYEGFSDYPPDSERAGSYRINEKIGRGGMGTVYLAERDDNTYESRVAVKILRRGMDTEDILARFRIERQILARLNHPNITHLLDGGIISDGRPYFVMEYIKGKPITAWCNDNHFTIRERIGLFLQICDALQYAHQNLVIHRDLKPGNIMVTDEGQVKLLDFGIAKLLDEGHSDYRTIAGNESRLLTPEFASPEQIKNIPINTSSDIYQLGIVLYKLLSGTLPFSFKNCSLQETESTILEKEPDKPSRTVAAYEESRLKTICKNRSIAPRRLKSVLKGDLDTIILKALQKEPGRRYASVAELKEDLVRYLDGLPIKASQGKIPYKMMKFARRNIRAVSMVSGFLCLLLLLGLLHSQTVTHERNLALKEAEKAQQIKDFMVDLMHSLDPAEVGGEPVSATLLLDRGAERVLESSHQDAGVRGELLLTMAGVYLNLDLHEPSQKLYTEFFDHLENSPDFEKRNLLEMRGHKQQAHLYSEQGNYEKALIAYEKMKPALKSTFPDEKDLIAKFYSNYALNLRMMGEFKAADSLFQIALEKHNELYDEYHPDLTRVQSRYASLLTDMGDLEEAKIYQKKVLQSNRSHFGDVHTQVLRETNNLAATYTRLGEFGRADSMFTEALALAEQLYDEHHSIINIIIQNQASVKGRLGNYEEAIVMYNHVLRQRKESGTYSHPTTGFNTLGMSNILMKLGRYEEAMAKAEESLKLFGFGLPAQHWAFNAAKMFLTEANFRMGEYSPDMADTIEDYYESLKETRGENDEFTQRAFSLLVEIDSMDK